MVPGRARFGQRLLHQHVLVEEARRPRLHETRGQPCRVGAEHEVAVLGNARPVAVVRRRSSPWTPRARTPWCRGRARACCARRPRAAGPPTRRRRPAGGPRRRAGSVRRWRRRCRRRSAPWRPCLARHAPVRGLHEAHGVDVHLQADAAAALQARQPAPQVRLQQHAPGRLEEQAEAVAAAQQPERRRRRPQHLEAEALLLRPREACQRGGRALGLGLAGGPRRSPPRGGRRGAGRAPPVPPPPAP